MAISLLYFIGNSDIAVNGDNSFFKGKFREYTRKLHSSVTHSKIKSMEAGFKVNEKEIQFPIFYSVIKYLRKKDVKISTLYLIFTDQFPHHPQDTIYAEKLLKIYCEKILKETEVKEICISEPPSDYDKMAKFFEGEIEKIKSEIKDNFENYITVGPGVPATYLSLSLIMNEYNTKFLYPTRKEHSIFPEVKEVKLFTSLKRKHSVEILKPIINSYQYKIAKEVLEKTDLRYLNDIKPLLEGLNFCLNDDFEKAKKKFEYLPYEIKEKDTLRDFLNFVSNILKGEKDAILDIYYKLEIKKLTSQYVEFIGILFNLKENLAKYIFENYFKVKLEKESGEFKEFCRFVERNEELKEHLDSKKLNWKEPTTPVINAILSFFKEKEDIDESLKKKIETFLKFAHFLEESKKVEGEKEEITLLQLRNLGRYAHGIKGINEELISQFHPKKRIEGILEDIKSYLKNILEESIPDNFYTQVNAFIIKYLEEQTD